MSRIDNQKRLMDWARAAFGESDATRLAQRGIRLLEEATEAFQACGGTAELVHRLVDYVFGRPIGELNQEIGGVSVALLVLAEAAGLDASTEENREIERILAKPLKHFTDRNAAKNEAGLKAP